MSKKQYSLHLVSDKDEKPLVLTFNTLGLRVFIGLFIFIFCAVICLALFSIPNALKYKQVSLENKELIRDRLKVTEILGDYNRIRQMDRYIRSVLGPDLKLASLDSIQFDSTLTPDGLILPRHEEPIEISYLDNIPIYPPVDGYITQGFNDDYIFPEENHYGVDVSAPTGAPIKASASGVVVFSDWTNHLGYTIILYHSDGYFTIYGHNLRNIVNDHQYVNRGEVIAYLGDTGLSAGPHLHFEIWREGNPIDPTSIIYSYRKKDISIFNPGG